LKTVSAYDFGGRFFTTRGDTFFFDAFGLAVPSVAFRFCKSLRTVS